MTFKFLLTVADVSVMLNNMSTYYTVIIPFVAARFATEWHPTEKVGPFSTLSRGAFPTPEAAIEWAQLHLGGAPYTVKEVR